MNGEITTLRNILLLLEITYCENLHCILGKSNILDAICFLLGITNLTHVRAANLQGRTCRN